MATYLIGSEITIKRQTGDVADLVITVPAVLSLTGLQAWFQVTDTNNKKIIDKLPADITIVGQVITIHLAAEETNNHVGKFRWSLKVTGPIHIGRGVFEIINN